MGTISLKISEHKLHIKMHSSFLESKDELNEKLQIFKAQADRKIEVFLSADFHLSEDELKALFLLMYQNNCILVKIVNSEVKKRLAIIEDKLRSGQNYRYDTDVLFCADIPSGVFIELVNGDMYVMGEISGSVECHTPYQQVMAQSFNDAKIKIYDSPWVTMNTLVRSCCKYKQQNICILEK